MTDDPYITAKNIAAGSKSLQKQITKTTKDFLNKPSKEWSESGLKPAETCEETDTKVHYEEIVKPDLDLHKEFATNSKNRNSMHPPQMYFFTFFCNIFTHSMQT